MAGRIKIHGALNFVGSGAELQNLELEELTQDPTGLNPEDLGRLWINVAEKRIKCVIELDSENRPVIETLPRNTDIVALQTLLSAKADKGTTLSSYGITDALTLGSVNGAALGAAAPGVATTAARSDHVHPLQTTVSGNAGTATTLATARSISITGDATWTTSFNGSANVTGALTLANSGVAAGTYSSGATQQQSFTVDAKGRVTGVGAATTITPAWSSITGKPTTLSGYGITDAVPTNVLNILAGNIAVMSGSNTTIPYDNTTPLATEGALVMQATVNPRGIDSRFAFNFNSMGDASTDGLGIILALFRKIGSGAWNCVGVTPFWIGDAVWPNTSSKPITLSMMHVDAPATIEPVSYMLRIGLTSSGSWYLGRGQDATFGGIGSSNYTITEFKQ